MHIDVSGVVAQRLDQCIEFTRCDALCGWPNYSRGHENTDDACRRRGARWNADGHGRVGAKEGDDAARRVTLAEMDVRAGDGAEEDEGDAPRPAAGMRPTQALRGGRTTR